MVVEARFSMADDDSTMAIRVRSAVIWRSGSQIVAQLATWTSTFFVIRLLSPSDYGLFAMTQVVLSLMNLLNGYSFTGALVQAREVDRHQVRQVFGMLVLLNFSLAAAQFLMAPLAASYFRTPLVADMLRVQSLLYITTPFIMVPQALLSRGMDFRTIARVNIGSALIAAIVAPTCALLGFGVWTLVLAPMSLFVSRAIGLFLLGHWWVWPSFRFKGAGGVFGFGLAILTSELLWFVQTQADVFIAGRSLIAHDIGIYTTSLFLAQILVNKFVPALNEVAFPTYSRIQHDRAMVAAGFAKSVRLIMLVAVPFSFGLAVAAEPLVLTALGPKWAEAIPVVRILGFAMPFVTLQILYAPATNALGRPSIPAWVSGAGAVIMPAAYLIGVHHGPVGMAYAWLIGFPMLTLVASVLSMPVIGLSARALLAALAPAVVAGCAMAVVVTGTDMMLPPLHPFAHLAVLVAIGAASYALTLLLTARSVVAELLALMRFRRPGPAAAI
jgi:O-antigen/teichoic acid export membrane protein